MIVCLYQPLVMLHSLLNLQPNSTVYQSLVTAQVTLLSIHTNTRLMTFFSRITRVSWYQKGKTNLD